MARKPKPEAIYRIESYDENGGGTTEQGFSEETGWGDFEYLKRFYAEVLSLPNHLKKWKGTITWELVEEWTNDEQENL